MARAVRYHPAMDRPVISLLTDFGWDGPAAICRAVIVGIAPDAQIVDIGHDVRKYAIRDGAFLLWCALPYLPPGSAHVAVVDPGVGTERRPIAIRTARGDLLVGPDNGLLIPAARALGGIEAAHVLENRDLMLSRITSTFHGRDIFSPIGARLALGDADRGRRPCARGRGPRRPPLPGAVRRRRRARDRGRLRRQLRQRPAGRQAGRPRAGDRLAGARSTHRADDRPQRGVDDVAADVRPGRRGPVAALRGLVRARLVRRQPGQRRRSPGHRSGPAGPDPGGLTDGPTRHHVPHRLRALGAGRLPRRHVRDRARREHHRHQPPGSALLDPRRRRVADLRVAAHAGRHPRRGRRPGRRHGAAGGSRSRSPAATS